MIPAGLYVHVPFCLTRCGYCDFNTYAGLGHLAKAYVGALVREAELHTAGWAEVPFVSVFLGGGTPTTLEPRVLGDLLERLRGLFAVAADAEVTVEANPDTVDERSVAELRARGVTRLSLGVQSFDPAVLAALERLHPAASARAAFAAARRAGFDDVNLDLIYGAAGETPASWRRTLEEAAALGPDHVSAYALTIEPGTPLGRRVAAGLVPPPDPDLQAEMYALGCSLLGEAGLEHYEVSNWARPGRRCVHNLGYWEGRPYLGLGAGAHSYRDGRRWWNVRHPARYVEEASAGRSPVGGEEALTERERKLERLLLGLRTADGIPAAWVPPSRVRPFEAEGLLILRGDRLRPTERGLFLANDLVLALDA